MKHSILATLALTTLISSALAQDSKQDESNTTRVQPTMVQQILERSTVESIRQTEDLRTQQTQEALRERAELRLGGSGIGGGVVSEELISWCHNASNILNDAITDAREVWGLNGDSALALSYYKDGLTLANTQAPEMPTNGQVYTMRYVKRGIVLAQILGLDDILAGRTLSPKHTESLVSFFDHYASFTRDISERVDRPLYIPYTHRDQRAPYSIIELERKTVELSANALRELDRRFVFTKRDGSNMYSTMSIPLYLKAQSYLLNQVAKDLRETLYAESFTCQASRMEQLSENIQRYLNNRNSSSMDAIRLNRFTLTLRDIISKLTDRNCF